MELATFQHWRRHIDHMVSETGQCIIMCDQFGWPLYEVVPTESEARATRFDAHEVEVTCLSEIDGVRTRVAEDLVGDPLTALSSEGVLQASDVPPRLLVVCRRGSRHGFFVVDAPEDTGERLIRIRGEGLRSWLQWWPAMSVHDEWKPPFQLVSRDIGATYSTPRMMRMIRMSDVWDGNTVVGAADFAVRKTIHHCLGHGYRLVGDAPRQVVEWTLSGKPSPQALIPLSDGYVWDTIVDTCKTAGVEVQARLWWPGDPAVTTETGQQTWPHPMVVYKVIQGG